MRAVNQVVGVDAYRGGWVAVALRDGSLRHCKLYERITHLLEDHPEATVVAVDIPIGLPEAGVRRADLEAREFVGPRRNSVFPTLPLAVLQAATYPEALALARERGGPGLSRQSFALATRILEVDAVASEQRRIIEIHPEVSFRAMAGHPIEFSKKSWNGLQLRRRLLEAEGISLPDEIVDGGAARSDDVLDATAAAWTASRVARGIAGSLPNPPERNGAGRSMAIWY